MGLKEKSFFKKNLFLIAMLLSVVIAYLCPSLGKNEGVFHAEILGDILVGIVFFLHGYSLDFERLKNGLKSWKVHLCVQCLTFVVFPLIVVALCFSLTQLGIFTKELCMGFYFLGALPSTISSSVAMTSIAKGNVPAAIFNASFSGVIGIFLTPLIVSLLYSSSSGESLPFWSSVLNLSLVIFFPFVLGQGIRLLSLKYADKIKKRVNGLDRAVVIFLVFSSFSNAFADNIFSGHGWGFLIKIFFGSLFCLLILLLISRWIAKLFHFSREDEITTVFCGSKKTLASGVPMARALFGATPELGMIVLPILFYHQIQLFICSIIAEKYAKK